MGNTRAITAVYGPQMGYYQQGQIKHMNHGQATLMELGLSIW
jgi:hypothetical protein